MPFGSGSGVSGIQARSVTVSSAQLLGLHTTPVALIAAPGAGRMIVPLGGALKYHAGATPYTFATNLNVGLASGLDATSNWTWVLDGSIITQAADQTMELIGGPQSTTTFWAPSAGYENVPLALTGNTDVAPTLGNGTLSFYLVYSVITVATDLA